MLFYPPGQAEKGKVQNMSEILPKEELLDDQYLTIWQGEQNYLRTRWSVSTFFMSISFAILGLSFQNALSPSQILAMRLAGLLIYWFSYLLHMQFYKHTITLRKYLLDLEENKKTRFTLQGKEGINPSKNSYYSANNLLLWFGLLYTIGILALFLFKI